MVYNFKALAVVITMLMSTPSFAKFNWVKHKTTDDGIVAYESKIDGFDLVAFRGTGIIDAPIEVVTNYLYDESLKNKWMARTAKQFRISKVKPGVTIAYHQANLPIVSNREFIYQMTLTKSSESLVGKFTNVEGLENHEDDNAVRGVMIGGGFKLNPIDNGKKVEFDVWIAVDPKGIPAFLVNLIQRSWPIITIRGLREEIKSDSLALDPDVNKILVNKNNSTDSTASSENLSH
jgi:hypothetical protein